MTFAQVATVETHATLTLQQQYQATLVQLINLLIQEVKDLQAQLAAQNSVQTTQLATVQATQDKQATQIAQIQASSTPVITSSFAGTAPVVVNKADSMECKTATSNLNDLKQQYTNGTNAGHDAWLVTNASTTMTNDQKYQWWDAYLKDHTALYSYLPRNIDDADAGMKKACN